VRRELEVLQTLPGLWSVARSHTPRGRLMRGVVANLGDKVSILIIQLLTIPVLTAHWGAEGYGIWLMLCTIPTYIQLSDFGIGTAAGVEITQHAAKGEYNEALEILHSAWVFLICVVSVIAAAAIAYSIYIYFAASPDDAGTFGQKNLAISICVFVIYSMVATQMSLLSVVYRATNKFATSTVMSGTLFFLEGAFALGAVLCGQGLLLVTVGYLVIRLTGYVFYLAYLKRLEPWVTFGFGLARRSTLRRLAKPSFAALLLTLSNALVLQGTLLTLGWFYSPAAVAVFGAARTVSRIPLQFSGLFIRPSIPELTRAILNGNHALTRRITILNIAIALMTTIPFAVAVVSLGPTAIAFLSHGKLDAPANLFTFLLVAVVGNAVWTAAATPLVATNRQAEFSHIYAGVAICVIATPMIWQADLSGVGAAMALGEAVVLGVVLRKLFVGSTISVSRETQP